MVKLCEGSPPLGGVAGDVIATPRAAYAAWQRKLHHGFPVQTRQLVFGAGGGLPDPFQHKQQRGALSSQACLPGIQARKSDELVSARKPLQSTISGIGFRRACVSAVGSDAATPA